MDEPSQKERGQAHGESELLLHAWCNVSGQDSLGEEDFEKAGYNLNVQDERGNTPLHNAVTHLHFKNVQILLEKGADKEIRNKKGLTPLQALFTRAKDDKAGLIKMTELLLKHGARPVKISLPTSGKPHWHIAHCAEAIALIDAARAAESQAAQAALQQRGPGF